MRSLNVRLAYVAIWDTYSQNNTKTIRSRLTQLGIVWGLNLYGGVFVVHEVSRRLASPPLARLPSLIYPCLSVTEVYRRSEIPGSMGKVRRRA